MNFGKGHDTTRNSSVGRLSEPTAKARLHRNRLRNRGDTLPGVTSIRALAAEKSYYAVLAVSAKRRSFLLQRDPGDGLDVFVFSAV